MNITEKAIDRLIEYFKIKTISDLAIKLDTAQSTISGWKARNAIGALTDTIASKDLKALEYIFANSSSKDIEPDINLIKINDTLLEKAKDEASRFGLNINSYLEHLIIQDLKK